MIFVKSNNILNWFQSTPVEGNFFFEKAGSVRGARFHYEQLDTCQNDNNKPILFTVLHENMHNLTCKTRLGD